MASRLPLVIVPRGQSKGKMRSDALQQWQLFTQADVGSVLLPVFDAIQPIPFLRMQKLAGEMSPDGTHNYLRSTFIKDLSDEVVDLIIEHGSWMGSLASSYNSSAAPRAESALPIRRLLSGKQSTMSRSRLSGPMPLRAKSTSAGRAPCRMR
jgi:hypothetical protein